MHKWESLLEAALHLDGLQCGQFYFDIPENTSFAIWTDLSFRHGSMKIPKYTKYSEISIPSSEPKSPGHGIKKALFKAAKQERIQPTHNKFFWRYYYHG